MYLIVIIIIEIFLFFKIFEMKILLNIGVIHILLKII